MKTILNALLILLCHLAWGQIKYEKGYIVNNEDERKECLIVNKDWLNNPESFQYKLTENSNAIQGNLNTIKEFGIYNYATYEKAIVQIDTSHSYDLSKMSKSYGPEWRQDTLFLKVLVDGKASLYYYDSQGLLKFFYKTASDASIKQLVHKEYYPPYSISVLKENNSFRQQLYTDVNCGNMNPTYLKRIKYEISELRAYFKEYNKCMGDVVSESKVARTRDWLNFRITPGISYTSLSFQNSVDNTRNTKFDPSIFLRIGLEIEYILEFNKNKWSSFFEPTYIHTKLKTASPQASINYQAIEFPIGLRHYFFLKNDRKLFLNGIIVLGLVKDLTNSNILIAQSDLEIKPRTSFALGGGYNFRNFSLEARYYQRQDILGSYRYYKSQYQRVALICGYRFSNLKSKNR